MVIGQYSKIRERQEDRLFVGVALLKESGSLKVFCHGYNCSIYGTSFDPLLLSQSSYIFLQGGLSDSGVPYSVYWFATLVTISCGYGVSSPKPTVGPICESSCCERVGKNVTPTWRRWQLGLLYFLCCALWVGSTWKILESSVILGGSGYFESNTRIIRLMKICFMLANRNNPVHLFLLSLALNLKVLCAASRDAPYNNSVFSFSD
ncbi:uncharacterized protein EV154DRAFT_548059 [Mucor mucedo]|uniref:uncharacterized protein n=1 Tax=Mucor mucedo TaxID=29922 RepID=UPI00221F3A37|nr:uncharacterized protein EV154DRAFT_548059 [Mucor mucedo]KAI7895714.1 hypothetical protein EV154DRAFT_548059 [Mucor mucedo]